MEASNDEVEDGSIPDLTEVDITHHNGNKETKVSKLTKQKHSHSLKKGDEQELTSHEKIEGPKQKFQNTCGKICCDIKTALNTAHCFDNNQQKGRTISIKFFTYILNI